MHTQKFQTKLVAVQLLRNLVNLVAKCVHILRKNSQWRIVSHWWESQPGNIYVHNNTCILKSTSQSCSGMDWLDKSRIYPRKISSRYLKVITLAEDPSPLAPGASAEAPEEAAREEVRASSLSSTWGTLLSKRVPASS